MVTKAVAGVKMADDDVRAGEIIVEERDGETVITVRHSKNPPLSQSGKSRILGGTAHVFARLGSGRSLNLSLIEKA